MPYTPPAHYAVLFNFTVSGYSPPAHNLVLFNFGSIPPPPPGSFWPVKRDLISGVDDDDIVGAMSRKSFVSAPALVFSLRSRASPPIEDDVDDQRLRPRATFFATVVALVPSMGRRSIEDVDPDDWRPRWSGTSYVVTLDDLIVSLLW